MSAQHTPGPWSATEASGHVVDAGGAPVAVTAGLANGPGATEYRANARLIAAAPELLAALQTIEANLRIWKAVNPGIKTMDAWLSTVQEAIVRATGGTP